MANLDVDWYYIDTNDAQIGPVKKHDVKVAWDGNAITGATIAWNETLSGWLAIDQIPELKNFLNPPRQAPMRAAPRIVPKPAAARGAAPTPASAKSPAAASAAKSSMFAKAAVVSPKPAAAAASPVAKKPMAAAAPSKPKPAAASPTAQYSRAPAAESSGSVWRELVTPEGLKYYFNPTTNVTQWEKPEELKTEADREKEGEWYWIPDDTHGFVPAKKTGATTYELENGQSFTPGKKQNANFDRLSWLSMRELKSDLVMLDEMNQGLILYNLAQRFKNNEIYTNVGTILIACNPYKALPLYTPAIIDSYKKRGSKKLAPHVYEIADDAFRNMLERVQAQSIVISGESGAGKTECTKQALQYLAEIAGSANNVEQRILFANPILEAFGNAKTVRNNNSSRFGKYVEIFFDKNTTICGAANINYLLEKSRVIFQAANERNYHIFYQLVTGASDAARRKLKLTTVDSYNYLNQSGCTDIPGVSDPDEYREVQEAMKALGFTAAEMDDINQILSSVLHLGNVTLKNVGDRKCDVDNKASITEAAELLAVPSAALHAVITTKIMRLKGQAPITISLSAAEATAARDALSKFIYEKQFDWLVQRINKSIGKGTPGKNRSIGVLDIFGFEIFKTNAFEQLCINFTNEKLQQFFNQHTFSLEERLYRTEGIKFTSVAYIDNQPVLDLIEKKPQGILPMIDEELRIPQGSDVTFVKKLQQTHKACPQFANILANPEHFLVRHYAGDVQYESAGFLEKNRDRLNDDAYALLGDSKFKFLASLFPKSAMDEKADKSTLGSKFRGQLDALMQTLNSTEPHYIRCIKPNPNKAPLEWSGHMSWQQLQYAGVFEAVKIRKLGFPFRYTHEEFFKRFKIICQHKAWGKMSHLDGCKFLIQEMKQTFDKVQIGTTRILYRAQEHMAMELRRNLAIDRLATIIQKWVRRFLVQRLVARAQAVRPVLQAAIASRDLNKINQALEKAHHIQMYGVVIYEVHQCERIKFIAVEVIRLKGVFKILAQQNAHECFDQFRDAVAQADDIEMEGVEADTIREMYSTAVAERKEVEDALIEQLKVLDEPVMTEWIKRADALFYTSDTVEQTKKLLFDTSEDAFVKMQLKASVALNDAARITKNTIRLKDLFFATAGDLFLFKNFGALYSPQDWADLKFLSFDREALARSMLVHSKDPIHAPLTKLQDKTGKLQEMAERCFKNLLAFMGDRKYAQPELLGQDILKCAVENKELRDEIYAQVMKQLSSNPTESSTSRGWEFMLLCLDSFPPVAIENYVENFIRKSARDPKLFVRTLHQTLYGGARQVAPTTDEMSAITGGRAQNRLGYSVSVYERPADFKDMKEAASNPRPPPPKRAPAPAPSAPKPRAQAPSPAGRAPAPKPRAAPAPPQDEEPAPEEPARAPAPSPRGLARPPSGPAPPAGPRPPAPRAPSSTPSAPGRIGRLPRA